MAYNTSMTEMIQKLRALTEDFTQSSIEVFTYETSNIFTLTEPRIAEITSVLINGLEAESAEWTYEFDATTNKLTITNSEFESGDSIEVQFTFSKLSDTELFEHIRAALVWLSIYDEKSIAHKLLATGTIVPTPDAKPLDLICIIASILIKPDYISYKTGNMSVTYPTKMTKEEKIQSTVTTFNTGIGVVRIIKYDGCW